jgi:hypothetical protein
MRLLNLSGVHLDGTPQHVRPTASPQPGHGKPRRAPRKRFFPENSASDRRIRLWNGKVKDAQFSIGRIRKVMHAFQGELGSRRSDAPSRKLWTALMRNIILGLLLATLTLASALAATLPLEDGNYNR